MNHLSQICETGTDINYNYTMLSQTHGFVSSYYEDNLRLYPTNLTYAGSIRKSIFTKHNTVTTTIIITIIIMSSTNLCMGQYP